MRSASCLVLAISGLALAVADEDQGRHVRQLRLDQEHGGLARAARFGKPAFARFADGIGIGCAGLCFALRFPAAQVLAQLGGEAFFPREIFACRFIHVKRLGDIAPCAQAAKR